MCPSTDIRRTPGDARQDSLFRAICDYRRCAPAYLAMEERRRQELAGAARAAWADPGRSRSTVIIRVLHRTGGALIGAGQRLQGVGGVFPHAAARD